MRNRDTRLMIAIFLALMIYAGSVTVMFDDVRKSAFKEGYQEALDKTVYINLYNPNDFNCTIYGLDEMSLDPGLRDALELSKSRNNFYNIKMIADEEFLIPYPHIRVNFTRLGVGVATIDCGNLTQVSRLASSPSGTVSWMDP